MNKLEQGVSVVVCTLNRGECLLDTIQDLLAQRHRPLEILVVDQSTETDPRLTQLVARNVDTLSYHKVQFRGLPLARNYGWQYSTYEAIVFVDDDIRCDSSLVGEHLRALSLPNIAMVAGGIDERLGCEADHALPGRFNSWTASAVRSFASKGQHLVQHVGGCNFSAWRWALREVGGFDEALAGGASLYEETELSLRVRQRGHDIHFNGRARLQHLASAIGGCRVPDLPKYISALGHNRAIMIERHLRWFQAPVAYLRVCLLFMSYALHYHSPKIVLSGLLGLSRGLRAAKRTPICTTYTSRIPS